ncbi:hypothetical protein [Cysteiniphilum litorale]|uniref:hypothetical protein n=1 Tax=Cysteiniphilum litorale TaxID=2056700 RepID=UPI003F8824F1
MEKDKDYGAPSSMGVGLFSCLIGVGIATYYLFWIPWIGVKVAMIIALIGILIYYLKIIYYYGLPDFPPHYIFDWWGLGINSTSSSVHILPFPNITVNATDYSINFNQYYYL